MPEQVADDLAPQDLAQMEGALSVTTQVSQHPFHEGTTWLELRGATTPSMT